MSARPGEVTEIHTRLMKCTLEVHEARAYWERAVPGTPADPQEAFDQYWFGAKSLARVKVLLANFRARYDSFPEALRVLHAWRHMDPGVRQVICHWHLQLADPLYRAFTGDTLVHRRAGLRTEITRDLVVNWVGEQGPGRWTMSTRIQLASKLLSASAGAGLVDSKAGARGARQLALPRVSDDALTYGIYLLRGLTFDGTLLANPYFRSVGLDGALLEDRLKGLDALTFRRQGDLLDYGWRHASLTAWAAHTGGGA
ncbi:MAG: hypothetical protein ACI9K2_001652 [Myxococcota bacterium]|jgi:hypothetical protein